MMPIKEWWPATREFFRDVWVEMKKVSWPGRQEVVGTTVVVIVACFVFGFYLFVRRQRAVLADRQDLQRRRESCRHDRPRRKAKNWYIVHTYSGFEERVKAEPRSSASRRSACSEKFGEIRIPTETLVEMKGGKKREIQRKFFPGYILVEMEMSDEAWHLVKNTPKVTGFVGTGKKPTPLTAEEVEQILDQVSSTKEKPKPKHVFEKGEHVRIIDGPFTNFTGVVEEVNLDRTRSRSWSRSSAGRRRSSSSSCRSRSS